MTEKKKEEMPVLIPEPVPLLKSRKGGVSSLIQAALLLEATRMVDDGMDVPHIEAAAKKAFGISRGFLEWMDDKGISESVEYLFFLSESSGSEDPLSLVYDNFFTPGESCRKMLDRARAEHAKGIVKWISSEDAEKGAKDLLLLDLLVKRFKAVAFMVSAEVVDVGLIGMHDVETLCVASFQWMEGPFAMMNKMGIDEALRIVTERMELSHRKEINFPIPKLLIAQAQKNEPWPIKK